MLKDISLNKGLEIVPVIIKNIPSRVHLFLVPGYNILAFFVKIKKGIHKGS